MNEYTIQLRKPCVHALRLAIAAMLLAIVFCVAHNTKTVVRSNADTGVMEWAADSCWVTKGGWR